MFFSVFSIRRLGGLTVYLSILSNWKDWRYDSGSAHAWDRLIRVWDRNGWQAGSPLGPCEQIRLTHLEWALFHALTERHTFYKKSAAKSSSQPWERKVKPCTALPFKSCREDWDVLITFRILLPCEHVYNYFFSTAQCWSQARTTTERNPFPTCHPLWH